MTVPFSKTFQTTHAFIRLESKRGYVLISVGTRCQYAGDYVRVALDLKPSVVRNLSNMLCIAALAAEEMEYKG